MPSFPKARRLVLPALAGVGLAFPFLVYFGLQVLPPSILVAGLLAALALRLLLDRSGAYKPFARALWGAAGGLVLLAALAPILALKAYPVLVSLGLAGIFAYSLMHPPPVVERIARAREPDLPASAAGYLRKVTVAWLCFFLFNASVSAWTALDGSLELWTLYNGFVSYLLIGALFAVEFIVRLFVRKGHRGAT